MKPTICYIDEETREINSFVLTMDPYFNVKDVLVTRDLAFSDLLEQLRTTQFDYLIVDYYLNQNSTAGYLGDKVIANFSKEFKDFPVMLLTNNDKSAVKMSEAIDVEIIRAKSEYSEDNELFVDRLNKKIEQYRNERKEAETELLQLVRKSEEGELTAVEEERTIELDTFLDESLDSTSVKVPKTQREVSNAKRLNSLIEKTNQLITKLEQK